MPLVNPGTPPIQQNPYQWQQQMADAQRMQQMAAQMAQQRPVQNFAGILANLAKGWQSKRMNKKADQSIQEALQGQYDYDQQQAQAQAQQEEESRQRERREAMEDFEKKEQIRRTNAAPDKGTSLAQNLLAAGYQQGSPEFMQAMKAQLSEGPDIGKFNPRDYTVSSFSKFQKTGDTGDLKRYEPFKVVDVGGVPTVVDKTTGQSLGPLAALQEVAGNVETIAGAKTRGTGEAAAITEAKGTLSGIESRADTALNVIKQVKEHSRREAATGLSSRMPTFRPETVDFEAMVKQLKGGVFLEAFQSLKGGGHITEIEGQKAEESLARLDMAQSEEGFLAAINELEAIIQNGVDRAKQKAGQSIDYSNMSTEELIKQALSGGP